MARSRKKHKNVFVGQIESLSREMDFAVLIFWFLARRLESMLIGGEQISLQHDLCLAS
jgi:hypothetical protein